MSQAEVVAGKQAKPLPPRARTGGASGIADTKKMDGFLALLQEGYSVSGACNKADLARSTAYQWRDQDTEFRQAWDDAIDAGTDKLEDVMLDLTKLRNHTGFLSTMATLKARRPDKWREDQKIDVALNNNVVYQIADSPTTDTDFTQVTGNQPLVIEHDTTDTD